MPTVTADRPPVPPCPRCQGADVVRNGPDRAGTPTYRCRGCGRRFVREPKAGPVSDDRKDLIRRLLAERMALRAIARAAPKKPGPVVIEADELWSFVSSKAQVRWVWVALDADTRGVLGMVVGDRSAATARRLWDALPVGYRAGAAVYTDFLASYRAVLPAAQHQAVGKESGLTAHVERFWLTLRQRCARFVRKTLSFSKCERNHPRALWYFVRLYNRCRK